MTSTLGQGKKEYHIGGGYGVVKDAALLIWRKTKVIGRFDIFLLKLNQRNRSDGSIDIHLDALIVLLQQGYLLHR